MSELRIRSEAAATLWPESWLPRAGGGGSVGDTGPLLMAIAAALSGLFGRPVQVLPASDEEADELADGGGARLAALLLSMRLGGKASDLAPGTRVSGAAWARYRAALSEVAMTAGRWPAGVERLVLLVTVPDAGGGVEDLLELLAPVAKAFSAPVVCGPDPVLEASLAAVPIRLRVELAAEVISLAALLPLKIGQVLAIQPVPEMRLRMGDHAIGRVMLQAAADGRQTMTLAAIDMEKLGERT